MPDTIEKYKPADLYAYWAKKFHKTDSFTKNESFDGLLTLFDSREYTITNYYSPVDIVREAATQKDQITQKVAELAGGFIAVIVFGGVEPVVHFGRIKDIDEMMYYGVLFGTWAESYGEEPQNAWSGDGVISLSDLKKLVNNRKLLDEFFVDLMDKLFPQIKDLMEYSGEADPCGIFEMSTDCLLEFFNKWLEFVEVTIMPKLAID